MRFGLLLLALALAACGGGGASSTAADCFNPQLFAVGTTARLDYRLSGTTTGLRTRDVSVQASPATGPTDVSVITMTITETDPPTPGIGNWPRSREVQLVEGRDIVTKARYDSFLLTGFDNEVPTIYQPPVRDTRYSLAPGEAFNLVRNGNVTRVTFVGQESVIVPAGVFTACRFEETFEGGPRTTWVVKGKGVVARSVLAGQVEELLPTSRLNGAPI